MRKSLNRMTENRMTYENKKISENDIDIDPLLSDVNVLIKSGLNKILYEFTVNKLMNELENCKKEMEYYKEQLELVKEKYLLEPDNSEHIKLKIEDKTTNDDDIESVDIMNNSDVVTNNIKIGTIKNEKVSLLNKVICSVVEDEEETVEAFELKVDASKVDALEEEEEESDEDSVVVVDNKVKVLEYEEVDSDNSLTFNFLNTFSSSFLANTNWSSKYFRICGPIGQDARW